MTRDVDEAWIEAAVERYRRIDTLLAEFAEAAKRIEVSVHSSDGLVEVVVTADGTIRDVRIAAGAHSRTGGQLSRSVCDAVTSANEAATWARKKLYDELFGDYRPLA